MFKNQLPDESYAYDECLYSSLLKIKQPLIMQKLNERARPQSMSVNSSYDFGRKSKLAEKIKEFKVIAENIQRERNRSERERRKIYKDRSDDIEVCSVVLVDFV